MNSILILFFDIIRRRKGPQDLPASQGLLIITALLLFTTDILGDHVNENLSEKIIFAVSQIGILTLIVFGILFLHHKIERSVQTLTAIYGTNTLIQLVVLSISTLVFSLDEQTQQYISILVLFVVIYSVWLSIVVMIHIYQNALDSSKGKAIFLCLFTYLMIGTSLLAMFPDLQQKFLK